LITDLAVFDFTAEGMILVETQEGITVEQVTKYTEAEFTVSKELHTK
jgi:3-oxoacid CoA-transferase subunit B